MKTLDCIIKLERIKREAKKELNIVKDNENWDRVSCRLIDVTSVIKHLRKLNK